MTISASTPLGAHAPLRLTVRGRRLVVGLLLTPVAIGIGWAAASAPSLAGELFSGEHAAVEQFEQHTVLGGETLWSIAEAIGSGHDTRDVVAEIMQLNQLSSGTLQGGQVLALPNLD